MLCEGQDTFTKHTFTNILYLCSVFHINRALDNIEDISTDRNTKEHVIALMVFSDYERKLEINECFPN